MSEYIFATNIFEYSNIRIYSSHSDLSLYIQSRSSLYIRSKTIFVWLSHIDFFPFLVFFLAFSCFPPWFLCSLFFCQTFPPRGRQGHLVSSYHSCLLPSFVRCSILHPTRRSVPSQPNSVQL